MLLSKSVMLKWNGSIRNYYEEKGYAWTKQNELFEVEIEDLQLQSTAKVKVKCDYCGEIFEKEYRAYLKQRELVKKDCCKNRKCMVEKSKAINLIKYGVENYAQTEQKRKQTSEKFRTPKEEILRVANNKNISILNIEDYKNDRTKLYIICNNHKDKGIQETNFANIKKNKKCCLYGRGELVAEQRKLDGKIVYQEFIDVGLEPRFKPKDYVNNNIPLPYICPKHRDKGVQYRRYGNLKYADGCEYCANESRSEKHRQDEDMVFKELKQKGIYPIEGEKYINKNKHIKYRCINHPQFIQKTTYGSFKRSEQCCKYCRNEQYISTLNRKLRSSINSWRNESIENCNNKCVLTGLDTFDVHHLYNFNEIILDTLKFLKIGIKQEYDGYEVEKIKQEVVKRHRKLLGICIHPTLHILFHQLYSKENNTKEQFEEFKKRYYDGEFDNELEEELKSYNSIKRLNN